MKILGILIVLLALAGAAAIFAVNRREPAKKLPQGTGVFASPEICDRYVPILLEGAAACLAFREKNPEPDWTNIDHTRRHLERLAEQAVARRLEMSRVGMGLGPPVRMGRERRCQQPLQESHGGDR